MNNLVTGATGFIGSFIAEYLVKRDENVRAFVRKTSDTKFLESLGRRIEIFYGDLNEPDSIYKAAKGMDKIFHLAAMVGDWVPKDEAFRVNVEGTRHILQAALDEKVKRFIFISTLAVLGMKDHYKTPSDAPRIKINDAYADTKIDSEELVIEFGKRHNLPFTVIRPGFVFGPRDDKIVPRIVSFLKNGKFVFIGDGKNKVNMIYVENLADAVIKASYSDRTVGQVYNITNDSHMTIMDVVYAIADIWGYKKPNRHVPKGVAYLLCNILEFFAKVTNAKNPPLLNKARMKFLSLNLDFDISKIKEDIGYRPAVDIREGFRRTKAWMEKTSS